MNNLPLLLTSLIAIISAVIPYLTTKQNNKHLLNLKEIDLKHEKYKLDTIHKRELFENFLKVVGDFSYSGTRLELSEITKAYYSLLPYIPNDETQYFREFSELISKQEFRNSENIDGNIDDLLHNHIVPTIKQQIEQ